MYFLFLLILIFFFAKNVHGKSSLLEIRLTSCLLLATYTPTRRILRNFTAVLWLWHLEVLCANTDGSEERAAFIIRTEKTRSKRRLKWLEWRTCFDHELELLGIRPIAKMERGEDIQRVTGHKFIRRVDVYLQHYFLSDSERTESDEVFALMGCCAPSVGSSLPKFRDIFKG